MLLSSVFSFPFHAKSIKNLFRLLLIFKGMQMIPNPLLKSKEASPALHHNSNIAAPLGPNFLCYIKHVGEISPYDCIIYLSVLCCADTHLVSGGNQHLICSCMNVNKIAEITEMHLVCIHFCPLAVIKTKSGSEGVVYSANK